MDTSFHEATLLKPRHHVIIPITYLRRAHEFQIRLCENIPKTVALLFYEFIFICLVKHCILNNNTWTNCVVDCIEIVYWLVSRGCDIACVVDCVVILTVPWIVLWYWLSWIVLWYSLCRGLCCDIDWIVLWYIRIGYPTCTYPDYLVCNGYHKPDHAVRSVCCYHLRMRTSVSKCTYFPGQHYDVTMSGSLLKSGRHIYSYSYYIQLLISTLWLEDRWSHDIIIPIFTPRSECAVNSICHDRSILLQADI